MADQLQTVGCRHLDFAKPPPREFPPPELRIKAFYTLEEKYHSPNPLIQLKNEALIPLTEQMVEYRTNIVTSNSRRVTANDTFSFDQETLVWIKLYNDAAAEAASLREEIEALGGLPFPEPLGFCVPFMPEGI